MGPVMLCAGCPAGVHSTAICPTGAHGTALDSLEAGAAPESSGASSGGDRKWKTGFNDVALKAVIIHALGDAGASFLVCVTGIIVRVCASSNDAGSEDSHAWTKYLDPGIPPRRNYTTPIQNLFHIHPSTRIGITIALAMIMAASMREVLSRSCHVLLERNIAPIEASQISIALEEIEGIASVSMLVVTDLDFEGTRRAQVTLKA